MIGDYPDRLRDWQATVEFDKIALKRWKIDVSEAQEKKKPLPPMPKPTASPIAPEKPRLRQHDVTIEQAGAILATAAPKGLMVVRDEIAGWLMGMQAYNPAGRAFWLEAYGGRPYRVERRSHGKEPIEIARLVVSVYGGTQPERLFELSIWHRRRVVFTHPMAVAQSRPVSARRGDAWRSMGDRVPRSLARARPSSGQPVEADPDAVGPRRAAVDACIRH